MIRVTIDSSQFQKVAEKGAVDGYSPLNGEAKVPETNLPDGLQGAGIPSTPPTGCKKVLNIYYDPDVGEYAFEREE